MLPSPLLAMIKNRKVRDYLKITTRNLKPNTDNNKLFSETK